MATYNIPVSTSWVKIAENVNTDLLVTWNIPGILEIATTSADSAPTVTGHRLNREHAITRNVLGAGYVWAKWVPAGKPASVTLIVSK